MRDIDETEKMCVRRGSLSSHPRESAWEQSWLIVYCLLSGSVVWLFGGCGCRCGCGVFVVVFCGCLLFGVMFCFVFSFVFCQVLLSFAVFFV